MHNLTTFRHLYTSGICIQIYKNKSAKQVPALHITLMHKVTILVMQKMSTLHATVQCFYESCTFLSTASVAASCVCTASADSTASSASSGSLSWHVLYEPQWTHFRPTMWNGTLHFCNTPQSPELMADLGYTMYSDKFLADRTAHSTIGYCHHNVVCLSVTLCTVAKRYILQQMSQQVNRKYPPRNTMVQLSTPTPTRGPQTPHPQNFMWTMQVSYLIFYLCGYD